MGRAGIVGRARATFIPGLCMLILGSAQARAADEPLWEVGLGVGVFAYDDYRGANSTHVYPVPVPYIIYNGDILKADRDGLHASLFHYPLAELKLSFNATAPVSNDRTRSGMPQLKPTVEAGATLDFHLWRSDDQKIRWDLRMPLRSAFAVESPPEGIGWTFAPQFAWDFHDPFGHEGWRVGFLAGPLFANHRYNSYFYSVARQYAAPTRPEYEASGGYSGTELLTSLSKRFPRFWLGAFVRYDTLAGSAFEDSPLVQRDHYFSAGIGVAWLLATSSRRVQVAD
jgi:outer membrane scaffolding protein for murein synthesis (MipA/OmpV family)